MILKSTGGVVQTVAKKSVGSRKPLGRSLMLSPAQLGLTAQDETDITAYLKAPGR